MCLRKRALRISWGEAPACPGLRGSSTSRITTVQRAVTSIPSILPRSSSSAWSGSSEKSHRSMKHWRALSSRSSWAGWGSAASSSWALAACWAWISLEISWVGMTWVGWSSMTSA